MPSEIAFSGGNLESKIVYRRVVANFENRKNISGGSSLDYVIRGGGGGVGS